jgi:hypothetical protein
MIFTASWQRRSERRVPRAVRYYPSTWTRSAIGSLIPASAKARRRKRQPSRAPRGASSNWEAGPRSSDRCAQFHTPLYGFPFSHDGDRPHNFNVSLVGTRSLARQLLKGMTAHRPAVRVARAIFRDASPKHPCCADAPRPTYPNRMEMGVAEWDVCGEDFVAANRRQRLGLFVHPTREAFPFYFRCNPLLWSLYTAGGRMPYEFVQMQSEAYRQTFPQNPLRKKSALPSDQ